MDSLSCNFSAPTLLDTVSVHIDLSGTQLHLTDAFTNNAIKKIYAESNAALPTTNANTFINAEKTTLFASLTFNASMDPFCYMITHADWYYALSGSFVSTRSESIRSGLDGICL